MQIRNCACEPLIVLEDEIKLFRFTHDRRPGNAQSRKNVCPIPHIDAMIVRRIDEKIFFLLNFGHGY